jgi:Fe-S cluster assembly iron-binding protein IscA
MLQLTSDAARYLINVRRERGISDKSGARFVGRPGRVGLTFAAAPEDGDRVVEVDGIKAFVAGEIAEALDESVIDALEEDGKTTLVVRKRADAAATAPNRSN